MHEKFFKVNQEPKAWADDLGVCHIVVTIDSWNHGFIRLGEIVVEGRKIWRAPEPIWRNEVVYYNTQHSILSSFLNKIVIHHTNNSNSVRDNEIKQQSRGYAALGYHFFIAKDGVIFEGRPVEIMGSHAGVGKTRGVINDPDWGAIGIVLQGDYHHDDNWFFSRDSHSPKKQLDKLEQLILQLKSKYTPLNQLLMHREVIRSGTPTVCPGDHLVPIIKNLRKKLDLRGI